MDGAGFRDRLFLAWSLWQGRHKRTLTQAELGELVGRVGGEAVAQNTVSGWFRSAIPDLHDLEHLAKALEVDPGWLAFGSASDASRPDDPGMGHNYPIPPPGKP
jgi:transcriptional regulator with XRE-family HTH domain